MGDESRPRRGHAAETSIARQVLDLRGATAGAAAARAAEVLAGARRIKAALDDEAPARFVDGDVTTALVALLVSSDRDEFSTLTARLERLAPARLKPRLVWVPRADPDGAKASSAARAPNTGSGSRRHDRELENPWGKSRPRRGVPRGYSEGETTETPRDLVG